MAKKKKPNSEVSPNEIKLDGSIATWSMKEDGPIRGTYIGRFKFKCFLTPLERIAANKEYRELLGNNPALASEHESWLAWALTQLKYRITEYPPFWETGSEYNGNLEDDNIITLVLNAAVTAETKYRDEVKKKKEEAINRAKVAAEALFNEQAEEVQDESEDQETSDKP